jgi:hypothetical protein
MALEESGRRHLDELKAEEKSRAEAEVYEALRLVQATHTEKRPASKRKEEGKGSMSGSGAGSGAGSAVPVKEKGGSDDDGEIFSGDRVAREGPGVANRSTVMHRSLPSAVEVADEAGGEEEEEEETVTFLPAPRNSSRQPGSGKVAIAFSERPFATPLRESRYGEYAKAVCGIGVFTGGVIESCIPCCSLLFPLPIRMLVPLPTHFCAPSSPLLSFYHCVVRDLTVCCLHASMQLKNKTGWRKIDTGLRRRQRDSERRKAKGVTPSTREISLRGIPLGSNRKVTSL